MQLEGAYHLVHRARLRRSGDYAGDEISRGAPDHVHYCFDLPSVDLLWLGAKLRLAAARGDISRVEVPKTLLDRQDDLKRMREMEPAIMEAWVKGIEGLQGQPMLWNVFPTALYEIAAPRVEAGARWTYASGSTVAIVGGSKGKDLPAEWLETARRFVDADVVLTYGMSELSGFQVMCKAGRYHVNPWVIPFILDPDTSELLPRRGVQTGRYAFVDLLTESHWGGLITGDEVEVDFDGACECGATTQHIGAQVARLSDKRGGSDKISCTATPQAYAEAMEFLTAY